MARALLPCAGVRLAILASTVFVAAACNMGTLGDGQQTYQDTSPGTVTLRLDLPSTRSFCDQLQTCAFSAEHISITTASGKTLQLASGLCPTLCSNQCRPIACPAIACPIGGGQAVTQVELAWDGSYFDPGTCGNGNSCVSQRFVLPGRYTAHMCATPGSLAQTSDVGPSTCTATGPEECVDVQFELPGPPVVEVPLPGGAL
jgi:hypothetical protein